MDSTVAAFADGGPWRESGEDVMARARAYVVGRHAAERQSAAAEEEMARRNGTRAGTLRALEVDDEFARQVFEFVSARHQERRAENALAGLLGSGKAAALWNAPPKSGIEMPAPFAPVEIMRFRGGFVTDDELREIADLPDAPISWTPPPLPHLPTWWLAVRHPWASLRGRWHGWRARRW